MSREQSRSNISERVSIHQKLKRRSVVEIVPADEYRIMYSCSCFQSMPMNYYSKLMIMKHTLPMDIRAFFITIV